MKYPVAFTAAALAFATCVSSASAASLQAQIEGCLTKHANTSQAATVMLECTATSGKLSACKIVESKAPSKGFENAAVCVAEALPMGDKTGTVRVPVRFPGA